MSYIFWLYDVVPIGVGAHRMLFSLIMITCSLNVSVSVLETFQLLLSSVFLVTQYNLLVLWVQDFILDQLLDVPIAGLIGIQISLFAPYSFKLLHHAKKFFTKITKNLYFAFQMFLFRAYFLLFNKTRSDWTLDMCCSSWKFFARIVIILVVESWKSGN